MFKKLCIIGVGLIGGSVARAARTRGISQHIVGFGREQDTANLEAAKQLCVIDAFYIGNGQDSPALEHALQGADGVIIATPVTSIESIFAQIKPFWNQNAVYSDVGSTKSSVLQAAERVFGCIPENLVPAHPVAGAEQSGVSASNPDLFVKKRLIITPDSHTHPDALKKIWQFWEQLGALVSVMDAQHHDNILAATSHLPHLLAFALTDMLGHRDEQSEILKYAAGGFKDFTRIASSDPTMWKDICAANKNEILPLIEQFKGELDKIQQLLIADDYQQLFSMFAYANTARQRFLNLYDPQS